MTCPNCTTENEPTAQFCENCGTKLEKQIVPPPMPNEKKQVVQTSQPNISDSPVIQNTALPKRRNKKNSFLRILGFTILGIPVLYVILLLIVSISDGHNYFNDHKNRVKEPSEMGRYTFDILRKIDKMTTNEFNEKLISQSQLFHSQPWGENDSIRKVPEKVYQNKIEFIMNDIKSTSLEYNIQWKEIEYMDFVYQINGSERSSTTFSGYTINLSDYYNGVLYFKETQKDYVAEITFIPYYDSEPILGLFSGTYYKPYDIELWERKDFEDFNNIPEIKE